MNSKSFVRVRKGRDCSYDLFLSQVLFEKKEYEFILDRACAQFEPDNQEYHEITFETFKTINENRDYTYLESTRHYGNLVFYLCLNKNLDSLLKQYLNNNQLVLLFLHL